MGVGEQSVRLAQPKRLLFSFGTGGKEVEVEVEDPENTTLGDIIEELRREGKLPRGLDNPSQIFIAFKNEALPLDLNVPISRLGLPDSAVLKVLPRSLLFGGKIRVKERAEIPFRVYGEPVQRERVRIPPRNPFVALKRRLANELRELGFEPISGSCEGEWVWRGRLCGIPMLIVLPHVVDANHPVEVWFRKDFCEKIKWFRYLEERVLFDGEKERSYRKVCVFPHDAQIQGALIGLLQRLREETGYECPELRQGWKE